MIFNYLTSLATIRIFLEYNLCKMALDLSPTQTTLMLSLVAASSFLITRATPVCTAPQRPSNLMTNEHLFFYAVSFNFTSITGNSNI